MKGMLNIEFILSVMVFLTVISFITYVIIHNIPVFRAESQAEDRRSKAYEISQLLMFDEGISTDGNKNWNPSNVARLGLSSGQRYVLSTVKIGNLDALCNSGGGGARSRYQKLKSLLTLDARNDVEIEVNMTGRSLVSCFPPSQTTSPEVQINRFAVTNANQIVRIRVSVI